MITQGEYVMPGAEDRILGQRVRTDRGDFKGGKTQQPGRQKKQKSGITEVRREFPEGRSGSIEPEAPRRSSEKRTRKWELHLATKRPLLTLAMEWWGQVSQQCPGVSGRGSAGKERAPPWLLLHPDWRSVKGAF